jgi:hypothetical protein
VASLVAGVLSLMMCPLIGVVALILGVRARRQLRTSGEDGGGLALGGIILGAIGTVITIGVVIVIIAAATSESSSPRRIRSGGAPYTVPTAPLPGGTVPGGTRPRSTPPSSGTPGPTLAPATCSQIRNALAYLLGPEGASPSQLNESARTVSTMLPGVHVEDVTVVLVDGLSRVGQRAQGARPADVAAAQERLSHTVAAVCTR